MLSTDPRSLSFGVSFAGPAVSGAASGQLPALRAINRSCPSSFLLPIITHEAEYGGRRYSIYRTYPVNHEWDVELYLEAKVGVSK